MYEKLRLRWLRELETRLMLDGVDGLFHGPVACSSPDKGSGALALGQERLSDLKRSASANLFSENV